MPRGGARPGAGRPRKHPIAIASDPRPADIQPPAPPSVERPPATVIPIQRGNLASALAALRPAASNDAPSSSAPAPAADVAPADAPSSPAAGSAAKYVGHLVTGVVVLSSTDHIRRAGFIPNEPDDDDCERLRQSIEKGVRSAFGDFGIPWYAEIGVAAIGLYAGMRIGARKRKRKERTVIDATPAAPSGAMPAPSSPQPIEAPASSPASSSFALPKVKRTNA